MRHPIRIKPLYQMPDLDIHFEDGVRKIDFVIVYKGMLSYQYIIEQWFKEITAEFEIHKDVSSIFRLTSNAMKLVCVY